MSSAFLLKDIILLDLFAQKALKNNTKEKKKMNIEFELKTKEGRSEVCQLIFANTDENINTSDECITKIHENLSEYFENNIYYDSTEHIYKCYVHIVDSVKTARHLSDFGKDQIGWLDVGKGEYFYNLCRTRNPKSINDRSLAIILCKL